MKSCRFLRRRFFVNNFFDMRDAKTKMTPLCSPRRAGLENVPTFLFGKVNIKIGPRVSSCQGHVKVRS